LETELFVYLSYPEAVVLHIELMRHLGETRYGVFDRALVESAPARNKRQLTNNPISSRKPPRCSTG